MVWGQRQVLWEFWGERSLQDVLPVEAVWRGQNPHASQGTDQGWGCWRTASRLGNVYAPWRMLPGTLPYIHATPKISSWSPKLPESPETSSSQTHEGVEEVDNRGQSTNVPFLLFTEGLRVQNHHMRRLERFGKLRDSSPANSVCSVEER